jgi:glycosyltransferase involved in cell wall biosynthesis
LKTISIITPTLNSVKTIERNLSSVSNQSTKYLEQIIIDGYSDDGTRSLIKSYEGHDIIFLDENERGIYQAINQGIKKARGKYIMLLNSDDWLPDDAINTVIKKVELNQKNIHIFISDVYEDSKKDCMS